MAGHTEGVHSQAVPRARRPGIAHARCAHRSCRTSCRRDAACASGRWRGRAREPDLGALCSRKSRPIHQPGSAAAQSVARERQPCREDAADARLASRCEKRPVITRKAPPLGSLTLRARQARRGYGRDTPASRTPSFKVIFIAKIFFCWRT